MSGSTKTKSGSSALEAQTYEVIAVNFGELLSTRSHVFLNYSDYGQEDAPFTISYYFWLIRGNGRIILVDTGYAADVAEVRGRTVLIDPITALESLGISADYSGEIVLTHAHYDHIGNIRAFPKATFIMALSEFEFWAGPESQHVLYQSLTEYDEIEALSKLHSEGRLKLIEGDFEVAPGVRLLHTAGHTPGELMVSVETASGTILLASDAVHFDEELARDMPFRHMCNLPDAYATYSLIRKKLADGSISHLIPGHDPSVMSLFPAAKSPLNKHAVVIAAA
jgi:glyoxylase-like metal-dependent hydrolase (beta-lactamase superfamily II)